MDHSLLLAATALDVTPPPGHRMDGYAARSGLATGTADPLQATIIWLSTEDSPGVLWLSLDAIAAGTELTAELAAAAASAAGIPAANVLVCASHTHSGPSGWTGEIHPVIPAERERTLIDQLVTAIADVSLVRRPVRATWRTTEVIGLGTNRHRRNGPHDNTAGILALYDLTGSLQAILLDFACHPTAHGPENLLWSADWPGATRAALAPTVVGYLQGAAGDVSPRFTRQSRGPAEVTRLGRILAEEVTDAFKSPGLDLPDEAPTIHRTTAHLPVRTLPTTTSTPEPTAQGDSPSQRIAQTRADGVRGQSLMSTTTLPPAYDLPLSRVTLGPVTWLHLPVELFAAHGIYLQATSPHPITRVIGYTDGYFGYIVDPDAAHHETYEALITYFDQPATNTLLGTAADLLAR
ncbi:hypothetical protein [Kribbella sp. NPDC051770]|uniref:hypothetical protein n=1 Tax=Kribbella sp. NPDC051770 TaxID=3155413 RepID=UPI0034417D5B